jgi:hypothetical protein
MEAPRALTDDEVEKIARQAVQNAVEFMESDISPTRITADAYYRGETALPTTPGRSKVVVSAVRDAVRGALPSLARVFTGADNIMEFYSDSEEDEKLVEDATLYTNSVFNRFNGYKTTIEATTDSLKAKIGVVEVSVEKKKVVTYNRFDPKEAEAAGMQISEMAEDEAVVADTREVTVWSLEPVPPNEFLWSAEATDEDKAFLVGRQKSITVSDAVEMGYPFDVVSELDDGDENDEDEERRGYDRDAMSDNESATDRSSRAILWTRIYIRMDVDGDGVAELRRIVMGGTNYKLLSNEPANFSPFAVFKAELQPHVMAPICMAEDLQQDQDAQTAMLRSIIDNAALVNSPRTAINEAAVNLDDAKNGEIGAIIRVTEMGQIEELATPFVAGQTLPVLQHLEDVAERRSGISKLSQGLDPNALQSQSRIAANASVRGGEARLELIARNIAETGLKKMFMLMLRIAIHELAEEQSVSTPEGFRTVNPRWWHDQISIRSNIGTGSGSPEAQQQVLGAILPLQQMFIEKLGMQNPIAGWPQARETVKAMLRLSGIRNINTFFPYIEEGELAQLDQQAQQNSAQQAEQIKQQAQAQIQQAQALVDMVKVEQEKNALKHQQEIAKIQQAAQKQVEEMQAQMAELVSKNKIDMTKVYLEDDRVRDKNDMDFAIDVAKLGMEQDQFAKTQERVDEERQAEGMQYGSEMVDDATEVEEPGEAPEAPEEPTGET